MAVAYKATAATRTPASPVTNPPANAPRAGLHAVETPTRRTYRKRELVFGRGDAVEHLCLLETGRIKLYRLTPDGREMAVAIVEPGETFGEEAVVGQPVRALYAEAIETSRVRLIEPAQVSDLARSRPDVLLELTRNLWTRLGEVERQMENLAFRKVTHRLAGLLVHWAEKYGEPSKDGLRLKIRLTHQEMASLIGSSRETVTLTLGQLVDAGLIAYDAEDRRTIVIPHLDELSDYSNSAA